MEIRVAAEGCAVPQGCFVGVCIGNVLRQARYNPKRSLLFNGSGKKQMHGRVDLFRRIATAEIDIPGSILPGERCCQEIRLQSFEDALSGARLKVSMASKDASKQDDLVAHEDSESTVNASDSVSLTAKACNCSPKARAPPSSKRRMLAKQYLALHKVEEALAKAVKTVLTEQPDNPLAFISALLAGDSVPLSLDDPPIGATASSQPSPATKIEGPAVAAPAKSQLRTDKVSRKQEKSPPAKSMSDPPAAIGNTASKLSGQAERERETTLEEKVIRAGEQPKSSTDGEKQKSSTENCPPNVQISPADPKASVTCLDKSNVNSKEPAFQKTATALDLSSTKSKIACSLISAVKDGTLAEALSTKSKT